MVVLCQAPLHWKDQIDKDLDRLVREGVIARLNKEEPQSYMSPAHFVEKRRKPGDLLKLRMVVDLHVLNSNT